MRIVFVGTFGMAPKSTMKVRALPLAQSLARRGHQVMMALPPWDNPIDAGRQYDSEGVTIINVPLPPAMPGVWYCLLGARLLRQVTSLKPDIVHAFKPKGFSGFVAQALLAGRVLTGAGPRVVVDTDDWEGDGGWNDVEPYPWWQKRLFNYQEQWLLAHADAVTAASRTLTDMAEARRNSQDAVYYLPNGVTGNGQAVNQEEVCRLKESLGLKDEPVALLYTRFVEFSPARAAAIFEAIAGRGVRPTVLLIGKGLHGEETTFLTEMQRQDEPLRVIATGWVEQVDLSRYFAIADVALFPMDGTLLNRAKCSAKLVDLLSAGVPVVAEAVGQCSEYIQDGATGLLAAQGDHRGIADAVARLLSDKGLRDRMGKAAQERMLSNYRWDILADTCEHAYRS